MPLGFRLPHVYLRRKKTSEKVGVVPLHWNMFLLRLAQYLTGIFIPIYLVQLGFSLFGEGNLVSALGFVFSLYVLQRLVVAIVTFPAAWAARSFGFRWVILFANLLRAGVFILLLMAKENIWMLVLAMVFSGMYIALYWPSFHTVFAEDGVLGHFGESVGLRIISERLAGVVGPVIGGVIVATLGFTTLFAVGIVVVLASSVPIFFMKHHNHGDKVSGREMYEWLTEKRFRRAAVSFVGYYMHNVSMEVLWPVFLFMLLASYQKLGIVFSVTALVTLIVAWVVGKVFDTGRRRPLFKIGSVATGMIWIVRATLRTFSQVLVIDSLERSLSVFYRLPYLAYSYERARGRQAFSFMVYREFLISVGAIIFWLIAIRLLFFPWFWYGLFGLAGLGVLMSQFILESEE